MHQSSSHDLSWVNNSAVGQLNVLTCGSIEATFRSVFFEQFSSDEVAFESCVLSDGDQRDFDGVLDDSNTGDFAF